MKNLSATPPGEIVNLLGKNWMTHDGMWFYHCVKDFGIEAANRLNKAALSTLAPIEIGRFLKAFQVDKSDLKDAAVLREFLEAVAAFLIPDFMHVTFDFSREGMIGWKFDEKKCFAYNGIAMLGVIEQYECGPLYRVRCWLDALGVACTVDPDVTYCVMPSKGECRGTFRLHGLAGA